MEEHLCSLRPCSPEAEGLPASSRGSRPWFCTVGRSGCTEHNKGRNMQQNSCPGPSPETLPWGWLCAAEHACSLPWVLPSVPAPGAPALFPARLRVPAARRAAWALRQLLVLLPSWHGVKPSGWRDWRPGARGRADALSLPGQPPVWVSWGARLWSGDCGREGTPVAGPASGGSFLLQVVVTLESAFSLSNPVQVGSTNEWFTVSMT